MCNGMRARERTTDKNRYVCNLFNWAREREGKICIVYLCRLFPAGFAALNFSAWLRNSGKRVWWTDNRCCETAKNCVDSVVLKIELSASTSSRYEEQIYSGIFVKGKLSRGKTLHTKKNHSYCSADNDTFLCLNCYRDNVSYSTIWWHAWMFDTTTVDPYWSTTTHKRVCVCVCNVPKVHIAIVRVHSANIVHFIARI